MSEQHETADIILRLRGVLNCCDDLEGSAEIAAELDAIRGEVDVMLKEFDEEYLTANRDDDVLIDQMRERLLWLDLLCWNSYRIGA